MEHLTGYTHVLPVTSLNPNGVYPEPIETTVSKVG